MPHHPTPLKYLAPAWFVLVMGLSGLALAWQYAVPFIGNLGRTVSLALASAAGLLMLVLLALSLLRWQRYPAAVTEDLNHPVRHVFVGAVPISLLLLATLVSFLDGPRNLALALWLPGVVSQFGVTVWALSRWLRADGGGQGQSSTFWPSLTPALLVPVVGNGLAPFAGVGLGFGYWSAAQLGIGLLLWPVVIALFAVRIGLHGLWPQRLLPLTFISVAPPAVIGLGLSQLGAPPMLAWASWGVALFFLFWSMSVLKRILAQPFSITFWALSFPLAAFTALSMRLAKDASGAFQILALSALAITSVVIFALVLATLKGLSSGLMLGPEPAAGPSVSPN